MNHASVLRKTKNQLLEDKLLTPLLKHLGGEFPATVENAKNDDSPGVDRKCDADAAPVSDDAQARDQIDALRSPFGKVRQLRAEAPDAGYEFHAVVGPALAVIVS